MWKLYTFWVTYNANQLQCMTGVLILTLIDRCNQAVEMTVTVTEEYKLRKYYTLNWEIFY